MTQTATNRKNEERLERAIASVKIDTDFNFATVASTSSTDTYFVDFNADTLYAESCTCKAGQYGRDCLHALAVDRFFDDERYQRSHPACTVGEVITEAVEAIQQIIETAAVAGDRSYAEAVGFTRQTVTVPATAPTCDICGRDLKSSARVCGRCYGY